MTKTNDAVVDDESLRPTTVEETLFLNPEQRDSSPPGFRMAMPMPMSPSMLIATWLGLGPRLPSAGSPTNAAS